MRYFIVIMHWLCVFGSNNTKKVENRNEPTDKEKCMKNLFWAIYFFRHKVKMKKTKYFCRFWCFDDENFPETTFDEENELEGKCGIVSFLCIGDAFLLQENAKQCRKLYMSRQSRETEKKKKWFWVIYFFRDELRR